MAKIIIHNLAELPEACAPFLKVLGNRRVVAFYGAMGVGKTTFIAELCRHLGVEDTAASPSFAIINEYRSQPKGELIYHFDFYRLDTADDAREIGAEEYFYSGNLCLIEWPERVEELLPDDCVRVNITEDSENSCRIIEIPEQ